MAVYEDGVSGTVRAGQLEDTLLLAPRTSDLADEDLAVQPTAEANEVVPSVAAESETAVALTNPEAVQEQNATPLNADEILALADQIAAGAAPLIRPFRV